MTIKNILNNNFKHIFVLVIFCCISLLYFSPVLQGKKILQNDIVQYDSSENSLKYLTNTLTSEYSPIRYKKNRLTTALN